MRRQRRPRLIRRSRNSFRNRFSRVIGRLRPPRPHRELLEQRLLARILRSPGGTRRSKRPTLRCLERAGTLAFRPLPASGLLLPVPSRPGFSKPRLCRVERLMAPEHRPRASYTFRTTPPFSGALPATRLRQRRMRSLRMVQRDMCGLWATRRAARPIFRSRPVSNLISIGHRHARRRLPAS